MVHSEVRRSPRTAAPLSPALGLKSPIAKAKKAGSTPSGKASPSPARRLAVAQALRGEGTPKRGPSASSTPGVGSAKNYKEEEPLTVRLNVYDLVWNRHDESGTAKNAASGVLLFDRMDGACKPLMMLWRRACAIKLLIVSYGLGFENLGFGLYHSALEIWGKEISFGHSKRYKSGVFAVKPRRVLFPILILLAAALFFCR